MPQEVAPCWPNDAVKKSALTQLSLQLYEPPHPLTGTRAAGEKEERKKIKINQTCMLHRDIIKYFFNIKCPSLRQEKSTSGPNTLQEAIRVGLVWLHSDFLFMPGA